MPFDFVTMLTAVAKAIPALAGLCERLIGLFESMDKKRNEKVSLERLEKKDADVDAAIALANRVLPSEVEQQPAADQPSGVPKGS